MRFIKWFGICSILFSTSLSAFPSIELEAASEDRERCSSWGNYICPTTGETFDYDPPRCGGITKPVAKQQCEAACNRTCQDAGWQ